MPLPIEDYSVATISAKPRSISAGLVDKSKRIELKTDCEYITTLFVALAHAQSTEQWWNGAVITRKRSIRFIARVVDWLQENRLYSESPADVLNDYVATYVAGDGGKPRSVVGSGIHPVLMALRLGSSSPLLSPDAKQYIARVIRCTRVSSDSRSHPCLGEYLSLPQVQQSIGQSEFLKLASPKLLHTSFVAIVSITLGLIQETRAVLAKLNSRMSAPEADQCEVPYLAHVSGVRMINRLYFSDIQIISGFSAAQRAIFLHSILPPGKVRRLKKILEDGKTGPLTNSVCHKDYTINGLQLTCARSSLFVGKYASRTEELLVEFLCASLTVQPSDIKKLRVRDFVVSRNTRGVPQAIHCTYFKGRSSATRQTRDISNAEPMFAPLLAYLEGRTAADRLFCEPKTSRNGFVLSNPLTPKKLSQRTDVALISAMWFDDEVQQEVLRRLKRSKSSPLFLNSFRALFRSDTPAYEIREQCQRKSGEPKTRAEYCETYRYALPPKWPTLTHIKTTAVYAATDRYRADDLVNINSHTASTEKLYYLTDANKDWVNLNGRISRLVQSDLSSCVYKPSLSRVLREAKWRFANTVLTTTLSCNEANVNQMGVGKDAQLRVSDDITNYIVVELPETVVYMLHYLGEAEKNEGALRSRNPEFFFEDVLIKAEWLSMILQSMDPSVVRRGQVEFDRIAHVLPSLFDHELNVRLGP